jgi:diaminohydroxyphosphoribosylaminopyrimidine deaminase/5-amino-6-(5-phosphoribosylamino)uracil reductase
VTLKSANAGGNDPGDFASQRTNDSWTQFAQSFRSAEQAPASRWAPVFEPLRTGSVDDLVIVAQIGQSLDGRIATSSGHSKYINGPAGLAHLHRLRSLVDAVVVGVGTALADDPQLTVRRVEGPNPVRVVVDPNGRLPANARMLVQDGVRRLIITAANARKSAGNGVEIVPLPLTDGRIAPAAILAELAKRGMRRILIEGGADTVSRFFSAGCLDRLHVIIAPIILGNGRPSFILPSLERADQAERISVRAHQFDDEVLFDCDLSPQRVPISGSAKKST